VEAGVLTEQRRVLFARTLSAIEHPAQRVEREPTTAPPVDWSVATSERARTAQWHSASISIDSGDELI
jgi:hypothetical protein